MRTDEGDIRPDVTILDDEVEQVREAMTSDGPQGALLILMAHRDGRITLRSNYAPEQTAAWLYELAFTLMREYPDNQWPGAPQDVADAATAPAGTPEPVAT